MAQRRQCVGALLVRLKKNRSFLGTAEELESNTIFSLFEDGKKMDIAAFVVDITSHLNEPNLKLHGKDNSLCDMMTAVRSFQRKLEVFKEDLQGESAHFPTVQEQVLGKREVSSFADL